MKESEASVNRVSMCSVVFQGTTVRGGFRRLLSARTTTVCCLLAFFIPMQPTGIGSALGK